ncbi:hypothetical protein CDCA_CDCA20G4869 [Cyanidium caldarium]|uniref:Uncharacterized protein n=1 Tax=Cyanidium caldarium TaxID=2771 RepID=A0AAV9J2Z9_CYACA|nr:hypothetical protein CDCA_CDCA20G4869 [Cyanidium caldarium]
MLEEHLARYISNRLSKYVRGGLDEDRLRVALGRSGRVEFTEVELETAAAERFVADALGLRGWRLREARVGQLLVDVQWSGWITVQLNAVSVCVGTEDADDRAPDAGFAVWKRSVLAADERRRQLSRALLVALWERQRAGTSAPEATPGRTSSGWWSVLTDRAAAYVLRRLRVRVERVHIRVQDDAPSSVARRDRERRVGYGACWGLVLRKLALDDVAPTAAASEANDDDPAAAGNDAAVLDRCLSVWDMGLYFDESGTTASAAGDGLLGLDGWLAHIAPHFVLTPASGHVRLRIGHLYSSSSSSSATHTVTAAARVDDASLRLRRGQYRGVVVGIERLSSSTLMSAAAAAAYATEQRFRQAAACHQVLLQEPPTGTPVARRRWRFALACARTLAQKHSWRRSPAQWRQRQQQRLRYRELYVAAHGRADAAAREALLALEAQLDLEDVLWFRTLAESRVRAALQAPYADSPPPATTVTNSRTERRQTWSQWAASWWWQSSDTAADAEDASPADPLEQEVTAELQQRFREWVDEGRSADDDDDAIDDDVQQVSASLEAMAAAEEQPALHLSFAVAHASVQLDWDDHLPFVAMRLQDMTAALWRSHSATRVRLEARDLEVHADEDGAGELPQRVVFVRRARDERLLRLQFDSPHPERAPEFRSRLSLRGMPLSVVLAPHYLQRLSTFVSVQDAQLQALRAAAGEALTSAVQQLGRLASDSLANWSGLGTELDIHVAAPRVYVLSRLRAAGQFSALNGVEGAPPSSSSSSSSSRQTSVFQRVRRACSVDGAMVVLAFGEFSLQSCGGAQTPLQRRLAEMDALERQTELSSWSGDALRPTQYGERNSDTRWELACELVARDLHCHLEYSTDAAALRGAESCPILSPSMARVFVGVARTTPAAAAAASTSEGVMRANRRAVLISAELASVAATLSTEVSVRVRRLLRHLSRAMRDGSAVSPSVPEASRGRAEWEAPEPFRLETGETTPRPAPDHPSGGPLRPALALDVQVRGDGAQLTLVGEHRQQMLLSASRWEWGLKALHDADALSVAMAYAVRDLAVRLRGRDGRGGASLDGVAPVSVRARATLRRDGPRGTRLCAAVSTTALDVALRRRDLLTWYRWGAQLLGGTHSTAPSSSSSASDSSWSAAVTRLLQAARRYRRGRGRPGRARITPRHGSVVRLRDVSTGLRCVLQWDAALHAYVLALEQAATADAASSSAEVLREFVVQRADRADATAFRLLSRAVRCNGAPSPLGALPSTSTSPRWVGCPTDATPLRATTGSSSSNDRKPDASSPSRLPTDSVWRAALASVDGVCLLQTSSGRCLQWSDTGVACLAEAPTTRVQLEDAEGDAMVDAAEAWRCSFRFDSDGTTCRVLDDTGNGDDGDDALAVPLVAAAATDTHLEMVYGTRLPRHSVRLQSTLSLQVYDLGADAYRPLLAPCRASVRLERQLGDACATAMLSVHPEQPLRLSGSEQDWCELWRIYQYMWLRRADLPEASRRVYRFTNATDSDVSVAIWCCRGRDPVGEHVGPGAQRFPLGVVAAGRCDAPLRLPPAALPNARGRLVDRAALHSGVAPVVRQLELNVLQSGALVRVPLHDSVPVVSVDGRPLSWQVRRTLRSLSLTLRAPLRLHNLSRQSTLLVRGYCRADGAESSLVSWRLLPQQTVYAGAAQEVRALSIAFVDGDGEWCEMFSVQGGAMLEMYGGAVRIAHVAECGAAQCVRVTRLVHADRSMEVVLAPPLEVRNALPLSLVLTVHRRVWVAEPLQSLELFRVPLAARCELGVSVGDYDPEQHRTVTVFRLSSKESVETLSSAAGGDDDGSAAATTPLFDKVVRCAQGTARLRGYLGQVGRNAVVVAYASCVVHNRVEGQAVTFVEVGTGRNERGQEPPAPLRCAPGSAVLLSAARFRLVGCDEPVRWEVVSNQGYFLRLSGMALTLAPATSMQEEEVVLKRLLAGIGLDGPLSVGSAKQAPVLGMRTLALRPELVLVNELAAADDALVVQGERGTLRLPAGSAVPYLEPVAGDAAASIRVACAAELAWSGRLPLQESGSCFLWLDGPTNRLLSVSSLVERGGCHVVRFRAVRDENAPYRLVNRSSVTLRLSQAADTPTPMVWLPPDTDCAYAFYEPTLRHTLRGVIEDAGGEEVFELPDLEAAFLDAPADDDDDDDDDGDESAWHRPLSGLQRHPLWVRMRAHGATRVVEWLDTPRVQLTVLDTAAVSASPGPLERVLLSALVPSASIELDASAAAGGVQLTLQLDDLLVSVSADLASRARYRHWQCWLGDVRVRDRASDASFRTVLAAQVTSPGVPALDAELVSYTRYGEWEWAPLRIGLSPVRVSVDAHFAASAMAFQAALPRVLTEEETRQDTGLGTIVAEVWMPHPEPAGERWEGGTGSGPLTVALMRLSAVEVELSFRQRQRESRRATSTDAVCAEAAAAYVVFQNTVAIMPSLERAKVQLAGLELRNHSVLHRYELATMVTSSWLRSLTRQWYKLVGAMDVAGAPLTAMRTPVSQFRELYTTLATGRATAKSLSYGAVSAFGSSAMAASEIGQATAGSSIRAAARTVGNTGMTLLSRGLMRLGERQWQRGEEEGETAKGSRMVSEGRREEADWEDEFVSGLSGVAADHWIK